MRLMSQIIELVNLISQWTLEIAKQNGVFVAILALLGLFSLISALGQKCYECIKILFMLFIAAPIILVMGLINKDMRKERLKELGEIKAHLKENPKKWKSVIYYVVLFAFLLFISIALYYAAVRYFIPFAELNELSKQALANKTNITS